MYKACSTKVGYYVDTLTTFCCSDWARMELQAMAIFYKFIIVPYMWSVKKTKLALALNPFYKKLHDYLQRCFRNPRALHDGQLILEPTHPLPPNTSPVSKRREELFNEVMKPRNNDDLLVDMLRVMCHAALDEFVKLTADQLPGGKYSDICPIEASVALDNDACE